MIGDRLKEERARLGFNQEEFAAKAGITRRPYIDWESGKTSPNAAQLALLAELGLDVAYVITGDRSFDPSLRYSREEEVLIDNYRHMAREDQAHYKAIGTSLAKSDDELKKAK